MLSVSNYWLATIPLTTAGLAWLLSQFSAYLSLRQVDRRTLRETVYFLLKLRHMLRVAQRLRDTAQTSQYFFTAFAQHFPELDLTDYQHQELCAIIKRLLTKVETQLIADSGLRENYEATLLKLATVAPYHAYRLQGKDSLLVLANSLTEHTAEALQHQVTILADLTQQKRLPLPAQQMQFSAATIVIAEGVAEIEQVLHAIASSIGRRQQRLLKQLLTEDEASAARAAQRIMEAGVLFLAESVAQQTAPE